MTSDLQKDLDALAPLAAREPYTWEAFVRIRARLTPDRERVARAIANTYWNDDESWQRYLPQADAAIAAMGEP